MLKCLSRLTFFALLLLIATTTAATQPSPPVSPSHFEANLDGLMAAQFSDHRLAGVTISVMHNNSPLLLKGYGHANLANLTVDISPYVPQFEVHKELWPRGIVVGQRLSDSALHASPSQRSTLYRPRRRHHRLPL